MEEKLIAGVIVQSSINKLDKTLRSLDAENKILQKIMLLLTIATTGLTVVEVVKQFL